MLSPPWLFILRKESRERAVFNRENDSLTDGGILCFSDTRDSIVNWPSPMPRSLQWGKISCILGRDSHWCVHVPLRHLSWLWSSHWIFVLRWCVSSIWFFFPLVIYLLWILMSGVHVMSGSLSAWLFIIALILSNYHRKRGEGTFSRLCWNNKLAVVFPLSLSCNRRNRSAQCRPRHGHGLRGSRRHNASYQKEEQVLGLWQDLQAVEMAEKKKW